MYVRDKMEEVCKENPPIEWVTLRQHSKNIYYYGHSTSWTRFGYYPIIQLLIVGLLSYHADSAHDKLHFSQIRSGRVGERTAHQLGTPLTSLQGW